MLKFLSENTTDIKKLLNTVVSWFYGSILLKFNSKNKKIERYTPLLEVVSTMYTTFQNISFWVTNYEPTIVYESCRLQIVTRSYFKTGFISFFCDIDN